MPDDRSTAATDTRVPTQRQFRLLLSLGSGNVLLTGTKGRVDPLLRHGWVTTDHGYAWTRITARGLHALARAVARYGMPEIQHASYHAKVCSECGRDWRPKCKCGSTSMRFEPREVERAA